MKNQFVIQVLDNPSDFFSTEDLQRLVWPGNETEIVPAHLMLTATHNGGVALGAFDLGEVPDSEEESVFSGEAVPINAPLVGFVFGFAGLYFTPDGPRPKHCSHMLGIHPNYRDKGLGFRLKRAQWQMVRQQGLDLATWTYDPLLSLNAHLNISRLGAVCNTYIRNAYGDMRDELNIGLPSDRFQVDWWIDTPRVNRRLGKNPPAPLTLAHYLEADTPILNPSHLDSKGFPHPSKQAVINKNIQKYASNRQSAILLLEIPAEFLHIKASNPDLALEWRLHSRVLFEELFKLNYMVTDTVYLPGKNPRSFYVVIDGERKL